MSPSQDTSSLSRERPKPPPLKRDPVLLRYATVAVAATLVLLVGSALFLNVNITELRHNHRLTEQTSEVLRRSSDIEIHLRDAETGQRGYLLTQEREYLIPYDTAVAQVWQDFDALAELAAADPAQAERLDRLRPIIRAKLDELRRTIELSARSLDDSLAVVRTGEGQRLMEQIRAGFAAFDDAERSWLRERITNEEREAGITTTFAVGTAFLAISSAAFGMYLMFRRREQERLWRMNERLERTVDERTARLTEANQELDAFAYTVSHDLRAPLRALSGYAEALIEDHAESLDEEARHFVGRLAAAATQMDDLIQDLLAYSRLARADVTLCRTSLSKLVDAAVAENRAAIGKAGAEIAVTRPLPDVQGHPPVLKQALVNLIGNALKFVVPGVTPRVRIWTEIRGACVRLWVEDNGIGIAPEHQERIFKPFERLHGAESYAGTGIGLAIVRKSLERMKGSSGVVSRPGAGSRFWIELPAADAARPADDEER